MTNFIVSQRPEDGVTIRQKLLRKMRSKFPEHNFELSGDDQLEDMIVPARCSTSDPEYHEHIREDAVNEVNVAFRVMLSAAREWKPSRYGQDLTRRNG